MRRGAGAIVSVVFALAALAALAAITVPDTAGAAPPPLVDTQVASLSAPTALAFTPDGRLLATTQPGRVYVVGGPTPQLVLDLSARVCTLSERGMLGIEVHPQFATNHFIYLFFTLKGPNGECGSAGSAPVAPASANIPYNHVARFVLADNNSVSGETTIIDKMPSYNGNHNGGDLAFGPDGKLYVAVGDGGCDLRGGGCHSTNNVARDIDVGIAKILRVNADGSIPSNNPYATESTNRCSDDGFTDAGKHCPETWAQGFRNPFRMAFAPSGKLYVNDVGQAHWEEIDDVAAGADYGWNDREGPCVRESTTNCPPPPAGLTDPIHAYQHTGNPACDAITGAAFVPSAAPWPVDYQGDFLFADFGCGTIFRMQPQSGGGFTHDNLVTGLGANSAVHMEFGPDAALYFTTYAGGGSIRKLTVGAPPPPSTTLPPPSSTTTTTTTRPPTSTTTPPPSTTTFLSTLNPVKSTNGLGPFERDRHNGGAAAGDGGPIVVNGTRYTRGLGVYPRSSLNYNLGRKYVRFKAVFGIDDSCGNTGKVRIEVHRVIGTQVTPVIQSGTLTGASAPLVVSIDMKNADKLVLYVVDVGSNGACARSDWANARLLR